MYYMYTLLNLGLHEGPKSGPRFEGPHSAEGSSQVHAGPHRDHGHVMHMVLYFLSNEWYFFVHYIYLLMIWHRDHLTSMLEVLFL